MTPAAREGDAELIARIDDLIGHNSDRPLTFALLSDLRARLAGGER